MKDFHLHILKMMIFPTESFRQAINCCYVKIPLSIISVKAVSERICGRILIWLIKMQQNLKKNGDLTVSITDMNVMRS